MMRGGSASTRAVDLVEDRVGTNDGEMVTDSLTLGDVPFQETGDGAPPAQVRFEHWTGNTGELFADHIGIVGNDNPAARPHEPV